MIFAGTCVAAVLAHEIGHALAAWVQGISMVPAPAKSYLLHGQVERSQQIWISLGGVAATTFVVIGTLIWYTRERWFAADAVLAGVLVPVCAYTTRFLLAGRGHDGLEWQEAQSAVGASPAGHAIDLFFLALFLSGSAAWMIRRRSSLRPRSILQAAGLMICGIVLLVALQVVNNALLDPLFP